MEAVDQFAVGGDESMLGFDLCDDLLLGGEGWEGNLNPSNVSHFDASLIDGALRKAPRSLDEGSLL